MRHGKYCEPREAFVKNVSQFLTSLKEPTSNDDPTIPYVHHFVICGDFNTIIEQDSKLLELCRKHGLIDIMHKRNGYRSFATYSCGHNRIDFALISETLLDTIEACGYTPFCDILHSDHRGLFMIFNYKSLLHHRKLQSKNIILVKKYINLLHDKILQRNTFQRAIDMISSDTTKHKLAEDLDC